jgi:hypothetical protein
VREIRAHSAECKDFTVFVGLHVTVARLVRTVHAHRATRLHMGAQLDIAL